MLDVLQSQISALQVQVWALQGQFVMVLAGLVGVLIARRNGRKPKGE